jgi:hypothetical protein
VVGGTERKASTGLSAVILNRGGRYSRYELFEELEKAGFDYVLSMENSSGRYDLEALTQNFPFVRFVLLREKASPGEEINLAAAELSSPLFFVLRNDLRILRGGAEQMAELFLNKRLCTVPRLQDGYAEIIPTLIAPALVPAFGSETNHSIKTIPFVPGREGLPSLYPFDGIGIYERERFIRLGGFDFSIKSFYWQLMDFGFRSGLWGEEIAYTALIKLSYEGDAPLEDSTVDESCMKFILKNLAPVFRGDHACIPLGRFPGYFKRRGGFFAAWKEFSSVRDWVRTNRFRFRSDARTIAERWENCDSGIDDSEISDSGIDESTNKEEM